MQSFMEDDEVDVRASEESEVEALGRNRRSREI
jgi:hypothetical protein